MSRQQRRKVLAEEEFTKALSEVIERNYYPDLSELQTQVLLQNRRDIGDAEGVLAIRRAARMLKEHDESLAEADAEDEANSVLRDNPRPLELESLTAFHARVTSEDNAEFEAEHRTEIQEQRAEREKRFLLTNKPFQQNTAGSPMILASEAFAASPHRPVKHDATLANTFFFYPSNVNEINGSVDDTFLLKNSRDNPSDEAKESRALMPPPAAVKVSKESMVEYIPKNRSEKKIDPAATRFPTQQLAQVRSYRNHLEGSGDDASSTAYYSTDDASTDLDAPSVHSVSAQRAQGLKRKRRDLNTLVEMTPLITPGDASPLTTWGTVSSTPLILRDQEKSTSTFLVAEEGSRDRAARIARERLDERARRSHQANLRARDGSTMVDPVGRTIFSQSSSSRPLSARSKDRFVSALRTSYTPRRPSTSRRSNASTTPRLSSAANSIKTTPVRK